MICCALNSDQQAEPKNEGCAPSMPPQKSEDQKLYDTSDDKSKNYIEQKLSTDYDSDVSGVMTSAKDVKTELDASVPTSNKEQSPCLIDKQITSCNDKKQSLVNNILKGNNCEGVNCEEIKIGIKNKIDDIKNSESHNYNKGQGSIVSQHATSAMLSADDGDNLPLSVEDTQRSSDLDEILDDEGRIADSDPSNTVGDTREDFSVSLVKKQPVERATDIALRSPTGSTIIFSAECNDQNVVEAEELLCQMVAPEGTFYLAGINGSVTRKEYEEFKLTSHPRQENSLRIILCADIVILKHIMDVLNKKSPNEVYQCLMDIIPNMKIEVHYAGVFHVYAKTKDDVNILLRNIKCGKTSDLLRKLFLTHKVIGEVTNPIIDVLINEQDFLDISQEIDQRDSVDLAKQNENHERRPRTVRLQLNERESKLRVLAEYFQKLSKDEQEQLRDQLGCKISGVRKGCILLDLEIESEEQAKELSTKLKSGELSKIVREIAEPLIGDTDELKVEYFEKDFQQVVSEIETVEANQANKQLTSVPEAEVKLYVLMLICFVLFVPLCILLQNHGKLEDIGLLPRIALPVSKTSPQRDDDSKMKLSEEHVSLRKQRKNVHMDAALQAEQRPP